MDAKDMTLEILSKERPDLAAKAEETGVLKERARVAKLDAWAQSNPETAGVVAEAKAQGKSEGDVMPQLMAAVRAAKTEQPPAVTTAAPATGSAVDGASEADLDKQAKAIVARLPKD